MQAFIVMGLGVVLAVAGLLTARWAAMAQRRNERVATERKRQERLAEARRDLLRRTQKFDGPKR